MSTGAMAANGARTVRSFCRICTAACGIFVDVSGDEVVRVRGDSDHPFSHGYTCPKGRSLPQVHHHPDRLERPLRRTGNGLQPTSWDVPRRSGDEVALHHRQRRPGRDRRLLGSGVGMDAAGYRMSEALYRAIGTPARCSPLTIDGTAKVLVSDQVAGSAGPNPHLDYDGTGDRRFPARDRHRRRTLHIR